MEDIFPVLRHGIWMKVALEKTENSPQSDHQRKEERKELIEG